MVLHILLHEAYVELLTQFGPLNKVVNDILELGEQGKLQMEHLPIAPHREGTKRYDITVTNEFYLSLLKLYGVNSQTISLRRIIYDFLDMERFIEFGWEPVSVEKTESVFDKRLNNLVVAATSVHKVTPFKHKATMTEILKLIRRILNDQ